MQKDVESTDRDSERLGTLGALSPLQQAERQGLGVAPGKLGQRGGDPLTHPAEPLLGDHVRLGAGGSVGDVAEDLREVRNQLFAAHPPEALLGRPPRDGRQPVQEPDSPPLEAA